MSNNPPYPPYGSSGDNNPYGSGGDADPYGSSGSQNPYDQSGQYGQGQYGQGQYGGQPPYGSPYPGGGQGPEGGPSYDGVSIASFVLSLLCCTGPIGAILGFFGLARTKGGQRKGRWAAVTGIVLGILATIAMVAMFFGGLWIFNNTVRPDNAEVGQCVNIESDSDEGVLMFKKDCSEDHDGEIVAVEEVDSDNREDVANGQVAYCFEALDAADLETINGRDDIDLNAVLQDPSDVEVGDHIVCYVEAKKGKLDEKVLD